MNDVNPELLIAAIRQSFIGAEQVYTDGSCVAFFRILKTVFPTAKPYWSKEARHMIAKIGKHYYDITGRVVPTEDYKLDTGEYYSMWVAVAFPQKTFRKVRRATCFKL